MERPTTKDILKDELYSDGQPAVEFLYARYSGMLFSFILQFEPDRKEAENLLVKIFSLLMTRLEDAYRSSLSVYCWLQAEARKMILEYFEIKYMGRSEKGPEEVKDGVRTNNLYLSLLADASSEQQWVFRELFIYGKPQQALALEVNKEVAMIDQLFKECLLIIRKKLK